MKTEGILLTMMNTEMPERKQDIKTSGSEFGSLMTNLAGTRGAAVGYQDNYSTGDSLSVGSAAESQNNEYGSEQSMPPEESSQVTGRDNTSQQTENADAQKISDEAKEIISEELQNKMKEVLAEKLGLSEEDLMDLLEQMGISLMDLLLPINMETFKIEGADMEQLRKLLLEFHGVEDASAILTNPDLEKELAGLLKEAQSMAEKLQEAIQAVKGTAAEETADDALLKNGNAEESILTEEPLLTAEQGSQTESGDDSVIVQNTKVSAETSSTGNNPNGTGQSQSNAEGNAAGKNSSFTGTKQTAETKQPHVNTSIQAFVDKLNNAFQETLGAIHKVPVSTESIFDQVVNHIRVRVLPETTSMEMTLNPAHLGRVNISVSSVSGIATATMTVQNEAAKEALQSQLITLKETFAEVSILIDNKLWRFAANRLYYACYYAASALLTKHAHETHTHSGVKNLLSLYYAKEEKIDKNLIKTYSNLFNMRQRGDYEDWVIIDENDIIPLLEPAKKFITEIEKLINTNL